MTDHAACAPSSAATWMNCPASITKAEGRTRPASKYAKEGTAAHAIAQMILDGELFPPGKIEVEGETFIVGLPMLRALNPYVGFVQGLQRTHDEVYIERRVAVDSPGGEVWGTTDCAARKGTLLDIVDLKFGKGVLVPPGSAQLKIYAIAASHTLWPGHRFEEVNLTVMQPRMNPDPATHTLSARELHDWGNDELYPAVARINRGDTTEKAGPWCRWCVRKNECASFARRRAESVSEIFDDGLDILQDVE